MFVMPCVFSTWISNEQRLRLFFGSFGSQIPQSPSMRGTPPEDPHPKIVNFNFMCCCLRQYEID